MTYMTKLIIGLGATALFATFVLGLAHSIITGFAGFTGGLPFLVIVLFVLGLASTDYYLECVKKDKSKPQSH